MHILKSPVNPLNISEVLHCSLVRLLFFHYNNFSHEMNMQQMSMQQFIECQVICQTMVFSIVLFVLAPACGETTVLET